MRTTTLLVLVAALVAVAGLSFASPALQPATNHSSPAASIEQATPPQLDQAPGETPVLEQPAGVGVLQPVTETIDDCDLRCHREFTACRQGAGGSGGPGFPMGSFEACVDELERCLAVECGIGC